MALFRCASGGGAGGEITVTYDSDFYGQTITCTRGQKVYSKVASSSGSVVFVVNEEGDWLIECTIGQDTYSTTASIEFTTSTELVSIPDGSTVTPTDDVATWLACAGIQDKSYTTLSEVLADSETFNALLGDSNACAYMARCETWASGLVPTMTSNTTPSGVASASTAYSGSYAYMAFDKTTSTAWSTDNSVTNAWVQYQFTSSVELASFKAVYADGRIGHYKIQGSNDGFVSDVHDLYVGQETSSGSGLATISHSFSDTAPYTYYRLHILDTVDGNGIYFNELQFYANSDGIGLTESQYAMSMIGQYDVCCDALLGNATWASAIINSTYFSYVLGAGLIPAMTDNTHPSGVASASSSATNQPAYLAFTQNSSEISGWNASDGTKNNSYLQYEFPSAVCVKHLIVNMNARKESVNSYWRTLIFNLTASNDGTDFSTTLASNLTVEKVNDVSYFLCATINNSTAYKYYRFETVQYNITYGQGYTAMFGVQLYGDKTEKIHGTYNEIAYYLDDGTEVTIVDPSTLSAGTYTFGSTVAKDPSDLTADYTKTIRITPNTKEIVLRPDNALYWWGYKSSNLENITNANGWSNVCTALPTYNDYDIYFNVSGSGNCGVGAKTAVSPATVHIIAKSTQLYNSGSALIGVQLQAYSGKALTTPIVGEWQNVTNTVQHISGSASNQSCYPFSRIPNQDAKGYLYAFWYE